MDREKTDITECKVLIFVLILITTESLNEAHIIMEETVTRNKA